MQDQQPLQALEKTYSVAPSMGAQSRSHPPHRGVIVTTGPGGGDIVAHAGRAMHMAAMLGIRRRNVVVAGFIDSRRVARASLTPDRMVTVMFLSFAGIIDTHPTTTKRNVSRSDPRPPN